MKKVFFLLSFLMIFSIAWCEAERPYIPFLYGTYDQFDRVRIDFERGKKIDRIDFSWRDESEDRNSRVELYVDHMYVGSKNVWSSYGSFWVNREARYSVELRVSSGKVRISSGYIYYSIQNGKRDDLNVFLDFMKSRDFSDDKAVEIYNTMSDEEKIIVLSSIYAVTEQNMEASAVLEQEYADFIGKNNESVNLFNVIFLNQSLDRAYAGGTGYYFNGGTAYLNIDREKKIRSISVSWRKHDNGLNNSNNSYSFIQGTLYIDGLYQGSKTIRDFSYDTFYLFGKQAKFSAQLRISGGDVYISSVYGEDSSRVLFFFTCN